MSLLGSVSNTDARASTPRPAEAQALCVCLPGNSVMQPGLRSLGWSAPSPCSSVLSLLGEQPERLLPLRLTRSGVLRKEKKGRTRAGGQILALPAPGCSPHHPPDLLTQGLQCERVTHAWRPAGIVNKSPVLCRWEQRAHSSHTRILTVPEHSAGCHSFGPLPLLPFQTEMSFDAISLLPWG